MALLASLVEVSRQLAATPARSAKIRSLVQALKPLPADELALAVLYLAGEIRQGRLGIGPSTLRACAATAATSPSLSLQDLDRALESLAALQGNGAARKRGQILQDTFARATRAEQDFLVRLLTGGLRQGALAGVMLDALAEITRLPAMALRRATMYETKLDVLARVAREQGEAGLQRFQLRLRSPVSPMLAQPAEDVDEALARLPGELVFEWKMDGARIQLHKQGSEVRIFTRGLHDVSDAVPEIADAARQLPAEELLLDGEAIAWAPDDRPHPFQVTLRRFGRRLDVARLRQELPIRAYYFDCLFRDGRNLIDQPLHERLAALDAVVPPAQRMPRRITRTRAEAMQFYESSLASGHEGLMAKDLLAPYEAGNRGASWLKIKRTRTLDLVVLAAEWGQGRREGRLSNLHLGALDTQTGQYVMLGKTFKGLSDALLAWQTREFLARETHRDAVTVYLRPELVVEIAFSDLQTSPRYPAGLALRLARVKRYRSDKTALQADTLDTVRQLFVAQSDSGSRGQ